MPTLDQTRIDADRVHPRIIDLWWALRPLTSVIRFMNTGAHPDDETTAMLAAMTFRDGINLSYACSTRGEGGQNDIGTEAGLDLGALRTREMERACDVMNMRMYWHSETPEDTITDFGFSKSGVETLGKWGHARTLARFVEIIRTDKPDIICPTFLDISGQHGHHRAMTEAAHLVMSAAADPDFECDLAPWQVKKMYLPAWSGAGQAYDDDFPPPPATLTVIASDHDPISGWSWERIGQQSRAYHRTQGMGRWVAAGSGRDWPLHLCESHVDGPDNALSSGLANTLGDLARLPGVDPIASDLNAAQDAITRAIAAYPVFAAVTDAATDALRHIQTARANCPEALQGEVAHRLAAKQDQLGHVLRLAHGIEVRARAADTWLHPGDTTALALEFDAKGTDAQIAVDLPDGWSVQDDTLTLSDTATLTDPYRALYDPARAEAPALTLTLAGTQIRVPFEAPPVALPARLADITPARTVINTGIDTGQPGRTVTITLAGIRPEGAVATLGLPENWTATRTETGFTVTLPKHTPEGVYDLPLLLDGQPAMTVRRISHAHIDPTARAHPANVRVLATAVAVPKARIGYIGSGNDRVDAQLSAIGADVTPLTNADLQSDTALAAFDSIVIGIFAMRFRPGLVEVMPRLHRWTQNGGTLVTLYHRPWDNWDADTIPPKHLEIGMPSLRWRVTDEAAHVTQIAEHAILQNPNKIQPEDWDNWVKERGLYFAKSWDAAYTPLLEMADPDEAPHQGALLVADIGKGRHVHTSLILHHQMEHLVPGAYRLMANLVAPRR